MRFSSTWSHPTISIDNRSVSAILSVEKRKKREKIEKIRGVAQVGSALGSGLRSRWFKSSRPDFFYISNKNLEFSGQLRSKHQDLVLVGQVPCAPDIFSSGGQAS